MRKVSVLLISHNDLLVVVDLELRVNYSSEHFLDAVLVQNALLHVLEAERNQVVARSCHNVALLPANRELVEASRLEVKFSNLELSEVLRSEAKLFGSWFVLAHSCFKAVLAVFKHRRDRQQVSFRCRNNPLAVTRHVDGRDRVSKSRQQGRSILSTFLVEPDCTVKRANRDAALTCGRQRVKLHLSFILVGHGDFVFGGKAVVQSEHALLRNGLEDCACVHRRVFSFVRNLHDVARDQAVLPINLIHDLAFFQIKVIHFLRGLVSEHHRHFVVVEN